MAGGARVAGDNEKTLALGKNIQSGTYTSENIQVYQGGGLRFELNGVPK